MVCFSKTLITHLPNTIFQALRQSSQFFCYLKSLILCPLLSCWPPLKITWCEILLVSFLSSYVAHVFEICSIHCHISFLNIMRLGQFYDILSALMMKHMARGVGIGRWRMKCGKCNIFPREAGREYDPQDRRIYEHHYWNTICFHSNYHLEIISFFSYAIMYRIQWPKHIIVFATNQSSCCQTCGNFTKRKEKRERERECCCIFIFTSLWKRGIAFYINFIGI